MKSAHLLTVALFMIACTYSHSNDTVCIKDTTLKTHLVKNTLFIPVVNINKRVVNAEPDLPFFKDVLNAKRLFW